MHIKEVYFWSNGSIMAFNDEGEQQIKCQGFILDTKIITNLNKFCDDKTSFHFGDWKKQNINCDFSWWFKKKKD